MDYIITKSDGSEALYHSGIKGMHWGIRRYQNEDGTLTEAGKRRYEKRNQNADRLGSGNGTILSVRRYKKDMKKYNKEGLKALKKYGSDSKAFNTIKAYESEASVLANKNRLPQTRYINPVIQETIIRKNMNKGVAEIGFKDKKTGKEFVDEVFTLSNKQRKYLEKHG